MITDQQIEEIMKAIRDMMDETELKALIREKLEAAYTNGVEDTLEEN